MKKRSYFALISILVSLVLIIFLIAFFKEKSYFSPTSEGFEWSYPNNEIYFNIDSDSFILGNSKVEFTFNGSTNGNISVSSLKNLNYQFSYSALPETPEPGKATLFLNWYNTTVKGLDSSQVMNISASVVLGIGENIAEFWINISTQMDEYSVYKVTYPIVNVVGFADPSKEAVVLPGLIGKLIVNPRVDLINRIRVIMGNNLLEEFLYAGSTNNYYYSYQFSDYYDLDTLDLFYFGTKDPHEYYKNVLWNISTQGVGFSVVQFPENHLTPGIDYSSPYPVVVGMLNGDWYDAAKYYRPWSIEKFAKRGKLEYASGISSVFHDLDFKLSLSIPNSLD